MKDLQYPNCTEVETLRGISIGPNIKGDAQAVYSE